MEKKIKWRSWHTDVPEFVPKGIKDTVGKIPVYILSEQEEIVFLFDDGSACKFTHNQECCEYVSVDDVNGDWNDLIGTPLLVAEERTNLDQKEGTWTFYTFRSIKGSVDVRWYGVSNGFYSEEVDFYGGILE